MTLLFVILTALTLTINPPEERITAEVAFCNFGVPRNVKVARSDFNLVYSFELSEEGQPVKIKKIKDDHVGESTVRSCLAGWRFKGHEKGSQIAVVFQWVHGEGWTEMSITGPDFSQKIRIIGERCPYARI